VFRFSHTTTFELIPSVASVLPGALVTIGAEYGSFPVTVGVTIGDSRCRQRAYNVVSTIGGETVLSHTEQRTLTEIRRTVQHRGHYVWKKET